MAVLLDTNILVRLVQPHDPLAPVTREALRVLRASNETLCITQQNLVEFWAVATRPAIARGGLGFSTEQAAADIDMLKRMFVLLPEVPLQGAWERLVAEHRVSGLKVHDARLVAAMEEHGLESILTFNARDFKRYEMIRVLDPAAVAANPPLGALAAFAGATFKGVGFNAIFRPQSADSPKPLPFPVPDSDNILELNLTQSR